MIFEFSRYLFCERWADEDKRLFLDARKPFRFQVFPDNFTYLVKSGDTLFTIAGKFYAALRRPAGLWWVLADFQPNPIHDPTVALTPGTVIVIPSLITLQQEIFAHSRSQESRV